MKPSSIWRLMLVYCLSLSFVAQAFQTDQPTTQQNKQYLTGLVQDESTGEPLGQAIVQVTNFTPVWQTQTNSRGRFTFENIPIGRHRLLVKCPGYESQWVNGVEVLAGDPSYLVIKLQKLNEEKAKQQQTEDSLSLQLPEGLRRLQQEEQTKWVYNIKDKPNDEWTLGSYRLFLNQEINRFAGDRGDVTRLLSNYAGMFVRSDYENHLSVRGNSPFFLQWRLEDLILPNSNHIGSFSTNGGQQNILNPYVLSHSDFILSTPNANYGNALAGVMEARLRPNQCECFKFNGQLSSISGLQAIAEGKMSPRNGGSFWVAMRYSGREMNILRYLVERGIRRNAQVQQIDSYPAFGEVVFRVDLPKKEQNQWTIFGLIGASQRSIIGTDSLQAQRDQFVQLYKNNFYQSQTWLLAAKNLRYLRPNTYRTYWHNTVGLVHYGLQEAVEDALPSRIPRPFLVRQQGRSSFQWNSYVFNRVDSRYAYRLGTLQQLYYLNWRESQQLSANPLDTQQLQTWVYHPNLQAQLSIRPSNEWSMIVGLHAQYLSLGRQWSVEPRFSMRYSPHVQHHFTMAYAWQGHQLPFELYAYERADSLPQQRIAPYRQFPLLRAQSFFLGYHWLVSPQWRLRLEGHYQRSDRVPVDSLYPQLSVLNYGSPFPWKTTSRFVSGGRGLNYGLDLTLERFFYNEFYLLVTASWLRAQQLLPNGQRISTAFDVRFMGHILFGREFDLGRGRRLSVDFKNTFVGPRPMLSLDSLGSERANRSLYLHEKGYVQRTKLYWRPDLKLSFFFYGGKKRTVGHQIHLDFLNILNVRNGEHQYFNPLDGSVQTYLNFPAYLDLVYQMRF